MVFVIGNIVVTFVGAFVVFVSGVIFDVFDFWFLVFVVIVFVYVFGVIYWYVNFGDCELMLDVDVRDALYS